MAETYTKLFSSITASTVWSEPYATRVAWVTMLAMADKDGDVYAAIPGLARHANITLSECEAAIAAFMAPDPYSRTKDHEGRRIEPIDGGWRLLNWGKYREVRDAEERKDYQRKWDRENRPHRDRSKSDPTRQNPTEPDGSRQDPTDSDKSDLPEQNRTEQKQEQKKGAKAVRASAPPLPDDVGEQVWADFLALRSKKRAAVTDTVLKMARHEAGKAKLTLNQFLAVWCFRGSQGLQAAWLTEDDFRRVGGAGAPAQPSKMRDAVERLQALRTNGHEDRPVDTQRDFGRAQQIALPEPGPDTGL